MLGKRQAFFAAKSEFAHRPSLPEADMSTPERCAPWGFKSENHYLFEFLLIFFTNLSAFYLVRRSNFTAQKYLKRGVRPHASYAFYVISRDSMALI
jgi:hypothetical protein